MNKAKLFFTVLILIPIAAIASWTYTYNVTTPEGSESPTLGDDRIREVKAAIQERFDIDHYFPLTTNEVSDINAGRHRWITFHEPNTAPFSLLPGQGRLQLKTGSYDSNGVTDVPELWFYDQNEQGTQLTAKGHLYIENGAIEPNKIAANAVTTEKIVDGNVTTAKLDVNAVTSGKITDGTIVNNDISATASIALSKLELGTGLARMKIGTYTGDGESFKEVNDINFTPTLLVLWCQDSGEAYPIFFKTQDMGLYTKTSTGGYQLNRVRSIDANGFTVGEAGNVNDLAKIYTYIAVWHQE